MELEIGTNSKTKGYTITDSLIISESSHYATRGQLEVYATNNLPCREPTVKIFFNENEVRALEKALKQRKAKKKNIWVDAYP